MQQLRQIFSLLLRTDVINMSSEIIHNLVRRSQKGDADAFGELYSLYANEMYRFAYYYTSSSHFAEDAVSEAVLSAFQKIRTLKRAESFKAWMFKILFNCCKKKQKEKAMLLKQTEISALDGFVSNEESYHEKVELNKVLMQLSDEEREIVLLSFACGYKSEEIGEMLGLKAATVRSKLSRAVQKIRSMMVNI